MSRDQNRLIMDKSILHNAGLAVVRTPLLWLFSVIIILTDNLPTQAQTISPLFFCLWVLLIPITILAEVGQIRSVQFQYQGTTTSVSQVISHGVHKLLPLIVVWIVMVLLEYILLGVIWIVVRILLAKVPDPQLLTPIMAIAVTIAYPFKVFAQCGIVISNLPLRSSMSMVFRVVQKHALPIISIVLLFGVLHYITVIIYSIMITNFVRFTGYMVILLIISSLKAAIFTIAYINFAGEAPKAATSSNRLLNKSL